MTQLELPFDSGPLVGNTSPVSEVINAAGFGLDAQAALMHETAVEKGFWPSKYYVEHMDGNIYLGSMAVTEEAIGVKLALVHSEVTEVLEAIRKNQGQDKVVEEMADVIVRLLDLWAALKNTGQIERSLDEAIETKMIINSGRPNLHGNNF